jgi:hypothetical protein
MLVLPLQDDLDGWIGSIDQDGVISWLSRLDVG